MVIFLEVSFQKQPLDSHSLLFLGYGLAIGLFVEVSYRCPAHHFLHILLYVVRQLSILASNTGPQIVRQTLCLNVLSLLSVTVVVVQPSHPYVNVDLIIYTYNLVLDLLCSILELKNSNNSA